MSGPSRVEMFDTIMNVAKVGVSAWGIGVRQRQAMQYQKALSVTQDHLHQLYMDLEQENDYTRHEEMTRSQFDKIRGAVGKEWLNDPFVRSRFDRQWVGLKQQFEQAARELNFSMEKRATIVELYQDMEKSFRHGIKDSHEQMTERIDGMYNVGLLNDAERKNAWDAWRSQSIKAFQTRYQGAIDNRSNEAMDRLLDTAWDTTTIQDPEYLNELREAGHYEILKGEAHDQALTVYHTEGPEAAAALFYEEDSFPGVRPEDRARIMTDVMNTVNLQRSEERLERHRAHEAMVDQANEIETSVFRGESSWEMALRWLNSAEVQSSMERDKHWQIRAQWTASHLQQIGALGHSDEADRKGALYGDYMMRIIDGEDSDRVMRSLVAELQSGRGLLTPSNVMNLIDLAQKREELSDALPMFEASLDTAISAAEQELGRVVTQTDREHLRRAVFSNYNQLTTRPDGTPYTDAEVAINVRKMVDATIRMPDTERYQRSWLFWKQRTEISPSEMRELLESDSFYGQFQAADMVQIVNQLSAIEQSGWEAGNSVEQIYERRVARYGSHPTEIEQARAWAYAQAARLGARDQQKFAEDFGYPPSRTFMTMDGGVAFTMVMTEDGDPVEASFRLRTSPSTGMPEWYRWGGRSWVPFDVEDWRRSRAQAEATARSAGISSEIIHRAAAEAGLSTEEMEGARAEGRAVGVTADRTVKEALDDGYWEGYREASQRGSPDQMFYLTHLTIAQELADMPSLSNREHGVVNEFLRLLRAPRAEVPHTLLHQVESIRLKYGVSLGPGPTRQRLEDSERLQFTPAGGTR